MTAREREEGIELAPDFEKRGGILPCVVQDAKSGDILMLGYVNQQALEKSISSRKATFYSTSRNCLWTKGETSGDFLEIKDILVDCDQDSLLYRVEVLGDGVCHTYRSDGRHRHSCFYRKIALNEDGGQAENLEFTGQPDQR